MVNPNFVLPRHLRPAFRQATLAGNQMAPMEYLAIVEMMLDQKPERVLIFGGGCDSTLWSQTCDWTFVDVAEDLDPWVSWVQSSGCHVHRVDYRSLVANGVFWTRSALSLVEDTLGRDLWDFILIDGPLASRKFHPGRVLPTLYAAGHLKRGATLALHDWGRLHEREICGSFLPSPTGVLGTKGLALWIDWKPEHAPHPGKPGGLPAA